MFSLLLRFIVESKLTEVEVILRLTDDDGRASGFLAGDQFAPGHYKMRFGVGEYFGAMGGDTFFPFVEVIV